jgi:hypothetical protein
MMAPAGWPDALDPDTVCISIDVEWAAQEIIDDLRALLDQAGLRGTFFTTHAGVSVPGHERGLHPNFRRNGETWKRLAHANGGNTDALSDEQINRHVVETTMAFAPEAKGVRAHSLHYDSTLIEIYRAAGLEYECSYLMPLVQGLRPFWKEHAMMGLCTYWADHFDIIGGVSGFDLARLAIDSPGFKLLDLHPNIVYLNAASNPEYLATKAYYHDVERLRSSRNPGRGIRTLLLDLLDHLVAHKRTVMTVGEVNYLWRAVPQWR